MGFTTKKSVFIVLVCGFLAMWGGTIDRDVVVAQGRKPVVITRIFTGPDDLAHVGRQRQRDQVGLLQRQDVFLGLRG